jgi:hypothetical protein
MIIQRDWVTFALPEYAHTLTSNPHNNTNDIAARLI